MTLELYDGARVILRNAEELVINRSKYQGSLYPWVAHGFVPVRTWTAEGVFTYTTSEHPLDIVGVYNRHGMIEFNNKEDALAVGYKLGANGIVSKEPFVTITKTDAEEQAMFAKGGVNRDLFDVVPYSGDYKPKGDEQYRLRNGERRSGLLFFQDEIYTSQRTELWTRIDGKCRCLKIDVMKNLRTREMQDLEATTAQYDIVEILRPKAPAELASPRDNDELQRLTMMDETGKVYGDIPQEPLDPNIPSADDRTEAAIQAVAATLIPAEGSMQDFIDQELVRDAAAKEIAWASEEWNGCKGKFQMVAGWKDRFVPTNRLYNLIDSIAHNLGGEFDAWLWGDDPSTIKFAVHHQSTLRIGGEMTNTRWITLRLDDDLNNAMLPMKKRK